MKTKTILILLASPLLGNFTNDNSSNRYIENLKDTSVVNWMKLQADYSPKILDRLTRR